MTMTSNTGKTNVVADALSRKIEANNNEICSNEDSVVNNASDTSTVHSAESSQDFFVHFTERPINYYRNQIIFREAQNEEIIRETPFHNHSRTIIAKESFSTAEILAFLEEYHNGKQSAIHAKETLFQTIQNACRTCSFDTPSHFVITPTIVEDVTIDEKQNALIKQEHERAHRGIQEIGNQLKRA